jgi:putative membrane protein
MPVAQSLATLPSFLAYFLGALALLFAFAWIYQRVTAYDEARLISEGNQAAALTLGSALLGFAMPLASVIAHSVNWLDMIIWGVVAAIVQVLVYGAARFFTPAIGEHVAAGRIAPAATLAAVAIAVGLLNAACITW